MESKSEKVVPKMVPPDGGYGWVVAFGALLITMMLSIPTLAFGILLKDMLNVLGVSNAEASWTISIQLGMSQIISPIASMSLTIFSCRRTAFVGGLILSSGLILSYFAKSIIVLYITFGFLTGIGIGLARIPSIVVGSKFFVKNYSIVAGITFAGFSIGRVIFSPAAEKIKEEYGYSSTYLILGGICLNILVGAALYQPAKRFFVPEKPKKVKEEKQMQKYGESKSPLLETAPNSTTTNLTENRNGNHYITLPATNSSTTNPAENSNGNQYITLPDSKFENGYTEMKVLSTKCPRHPDEDAIAEDYARHSIINEINANSDKPKLNPLFGFSSCASINNLRELVPKKVTQAPTKSQMMKATLKKSLDITLLKDPIFYIICASSILSYLTVMYSTAFLIPLGKEKGISAMDASLVYSAKAGAEIFGRLGFPFIHRFVKINVILLYIIICISVTACLFGQALVSSFIPFLIFAILTGFITGGTVVISIAVMVESLGQDRYPSSIGLTCFIQGWFALFGGPLVGFVRDLTGNFAICYIFITCLQIASILLWIARYSYTRWCKPKST